MDEISEPDPPGSGIELPVKEAPSASGNGIGARYKLLSPAKLPISRTPCITIPPGLSPTSFLESPVLLSNVKAEPSPTTGSFFNPQVPYSIVGSSPFPLTAISSGSFPERNSSSFEFRPPPIPSSISTDVNLQGSDQNHEVQTVFPPHPFISSPREKIEIVSPSNELAVVAPTHVNSMSGAPVDEDQNQSLRSSSSHQASNSENKVVSGAPVLSGDGYNWRKYGQKHVKGSEFPRSYYKCTHPNCEVKKLFERSHDGQITEIIYKGTHDHPKPQNNRRYSAGAIFPVQEAPEKLNSFPVPDGAEKLSSMYGQASLAIEASSTPEQSPAIGNDDNMDGVEDEDDPLSKKRKMDSGIFDVTPVVKPIREPRVVVQTLSEVDILDDGYRWRKYGQKVVRGNPNPRSYYKCTHSGCPVRKHVERASHDPKAVITTYEGKHNHDVPTTRTSSHDTGLSAGANSLPRIRMDEKDSISLDLGVGIRSAAETMLNEHHQERSGHPQNQSQATGSSFRITETGSVAGYYGVVNAGMNQYGAIPNPGEGNVEMMPLNHPYSYPQNVGRLLTGP